MLRTWSKATSEEKTRDFLIVQKCTTNDWSATGNSFIAWTISRTTEEQNFVLNALFQKTRAEFVVTRWTTGNAALKTSLRLRQRPRTWNPKPRTCHKDMPYCPQGGSRSTTWPQGLQHWKIVLTNICIRTVTNILCSLLANIFQFDEYDWDLMDLFCMQMHISVT